MASLTVDTSPEPEPVAPADLACPSVSPNYVYKSTREIPALGREVATSLDSNLNAWYRHTYPLFQKSYNIGYPNGSLMYLIDGMENTNSSVNLLDDNEQFNKIKEMLGENEAALDIALPKDRLDTIEKLISEKKKKMKNALAGGDSKERTRDRFLSLVESNYFLQTIRMLTVLHGDRSEFSESKWAEILVYLRFYCKHNADAKDVPRAIEVESKDRRKQIADTAGTLLVYECIRRWRQP